MTQIKFEDLVGKTGILCAVEDFKFRLGNITFEAIEDKEDGYRSCLGYFEVVDNIRPTFREEVTISSDANYFYLTNKNNDNVLIIGTDSYDSYYPCFVFDWKPKSLSSYIDIDTLINTVSE